MPVEILIVAINARYSHCSFSGLTLLANLGDLQPRAALLESDLDTQPLQITTQILEQRPRLVGFSVYLWNTRMVRDILELLRRVAPELTVILGGPEIVPGCAASWLGLAAALVCGEGEVAFREWCMKTLRCSASGAPPASPEWIEVTGGVPTGLLTLPYELYRETDIQRRVTYVESARGCPLHCLYCTSCGTGLRLFPLPVLLAAWSRLIDRGMRQFRFLDRTFNADEAHACAVLDFFLQGGVSGLQLHLELSPVNFGSPLRERLAAFPANALHIEAGLQSLNEAVARRIGRNEPRTEAFETLTFLQNETRCALHVDLIFGLPGEDEASFAEGFDRLVRLGIPEIQVNRLKGLPGTPILQLTECAGAFSPHPPYDVLRTDCLSFDDLTRMQRFSLVWDRLNNRGRFRNTLPLLWQDGTVSPYALISDLAETADRQHGRVHALGLRDWVRLLVQQLLARRPADRDVIAAALKRDGLALSPTELEPTD